MKKILSWTILLFLCSCAWRSPDSAFYVMNSNGLSALSERKISVAVARVKVPELLDKQQLVIYEKDSDEVKILEFNRWAEVLPDMLQSTVTNDLMAYLPSAYVKRTYFDGESVNYSVNIEINQIKAYRGDKAVLSAWWNIKNAKGNILKRGQGVYEATVKGNSIADLVEAQSAAVHKMSEEIAVQLLKL